MTIFGVLDKKLRGPRKRRSLARQARPALEDLESRVVLYSASGNAWPAAQLVTISFMPDGTNIAGHSSNMVAKFNSVFGSPATWQNIILQAAQLWAQQTNINFAVVPDNGNPQGDGDYQQGDPGYGDIRIGGFNFYSSALAGASMPPPVNNFSIAGDITFNTGQNFRNGTTFDLFTVAAHEIGHALGLYHSGVASAQMYATYNGVKRALNADDTAGIRSIYGGAREQDSYYGSTGNGSFAKAYDITSTIDTGDLTALVTDADVTTAGQQDYYRLTIPSGTNGTMKVTMQSEGLSLLQPRLYLYNSAGAQVAMSTGSQYGDTITATYSGVTAGQTYYVKANSPLTTANGTGVYALSMTFGTNPTPAVPLPDTQLANGDPLSCGGGEVIEYDAETLVNTTTTGTQGESPFNGHTVAMDANGGFVVVWQSQNQDGGGWGIYAQRFDASGAAIGAESRVNTTTFGNQTSPSVVMGDSGRYTVVWASISPGGGPVVNAQRFDAAGVPMGGEFQVNTLPDVNVSHPSVAMDQSGNLLFTWSSYTNPASAQWNVFGRQFDPSGVPLGTEFQVNTSLGFNQMNSNVAMDNQGHVVVIWAGGGAQDSAGIFMQRFTISYVGLDSPAGDVFHPTGQSPDDHSGPAHTPRHWQTRQSNAGSRTVMREGHLWSGAGHRFRLPGSWGRHRKFGESHSLAPSRLTPP